MGNYSGAKLQLEYGYDEVGRQTGQKNGKGESISTTYSRDTGLPFRVFDNSLSKQTVTLFDSGGRLTVQVDPNENKTEWTHDSIGRVLTETIDVDVFTSPTASTVQPVSRSWDYTGLETVYTNRNGRQIKTVVDPATRLVTEDWLGVLPPVGPQDMEGSVRTNFDPAGQIESIEELDKNSNVTSTVKVDYDDLGRAVQEFLDFEFQGLTTPTQRLDIDYHATGQRSEVEAYIDLTPDASDIDDVILSRTNYDIDNLGRVHGILHNQATAANSLWTSGQEGPDKAVKIAYNADNTRRELVRLGALSYSEAPGTPAGTPLRGVTSYTYFKDGRLEDLSHKTDRTPSTKTIARYSDEYDGLANIIGRDYDFFDPNGSKSREEHRTFGYDDHNQLETELVTTAVGSGNTSTKYYYDESGNRIGTSFISSADPNQFIEPDNVPAGTGVYTVGAANRLLQDTAYTYRYDNEGNLIERKLINPPIVSIDVRTEKYEWDHRNRLLQVERIQEDGNISSRVTHEYDGLNRHVATHTQHFDGFGQPSVSDTTVFFMDGQEVLYDITLDSGTAEIEKGYLYGPAANELLAVDVAVDNETLPDYTQTAWVFSDPQGTARSLATYTNGVGWFFQHRHTNAFGNLYHVDGVNGHPVLGEVPQFWSGFRYEATTQLYDMQGSWFDSRSGRHISSAATGDTNTYRYNGNLPTSYTGPLTSNTVTRFDFSTIEGDAAFSGFLGNTVGRATYATFGDDLASASNFELFAGTAAFSAAVVLSGGYALGSAGLIGGSFAAAEVSYLGAAGTALAGVSIGVSGARVAFSGGADGKTDLALDVASVGIAGWLRAAKGATRLGLLATDTSINTFQGARSSAYAYDSFSRGDYLGGSLNGLGAFLGFASAGVRGFQFRNDWITSSVARNSSTLRQPGDRLSLSQLLFGARRGEGLPGRVGVDVGRTRPAVTEIENLTAKHGVEFAVTYLPGPGRNGGGGIYRLYSGVSDSVRSPIDEILIYHTHPRGVRVPSGTEIGAVSGDIPALRARNLINGQRSSFIIAVGRPNGQRLIRFYLDGSTSRIVE